MRHHAMGRHSRTKAAPAAAAVVLLVAVVLLGSLPTGKCQADRPSVGDVGGGGIGSTPFVNNIINQRMRNLTQVLILEIGNQLDFCIKDKEREWNAAFNFSSNFTFLTQCVAQLPEGGFSERLCTAAELKLYFNGLLTTSNAGGDGFLKPNKNCNLTSWNAGCDPGWACSIGQDQNIKLGNSTEIPHRTTDPQPCCAGFFCPRGLTCMIPCPLGSYCPTGNLSGDTGACDPYSYHLSPAGPPSVRPKPKCGAANIWADIRSSTEMFCPEGYYCPSTAEKIPCEPGYYCRKGSTSMQRCYKKSSCKAMSSNQDITLFGLLLIAALGLLLLIIYNFSDQILTNRERQQAKSREAAARSARETAQARERWKAAKDIAKRHAAGLQAQLSRTFSRKKSTKLPELSRGHSQGRFGLGDAPLSPQGLSSNRVPKEKKKEPINPTKVSHPPEYSSDSDEGFNVEIGEKHEGKKKPRGKKMHTRSQIFKYAYVQIEKEKALQQENKNLTFSGVISLATNSETRTRPTIEVAFKDLTLTLKRKKKILLRCVTGKLSPGRVTAVMGPSGAGKTTFLNALTGKTTGCQRSGLILINGKAESIRSYKKIIGFVPQDDIVHGNLTVEENLWFSARCRLPDDMSKADKVLVVERVIESLGLQPVRDSLVGTVEKRGISGGQRKRVNVGLEMVMEPSLLILDEPTSGLDSSSSQLLLRALRREAIEGVNVIMVVHQPSYTLYRMFDDLMLLAKGGLIVYHGSIRKVEEYFSGLGINVPDRVNPPDHYIDILEGIVKPSTSSAVNYKQLPVKWMQHNGYAIPSDMLHDFSEIEASHGSDNASNGMNPVTSSESQLVAEEILSDIRHIAEQNRDHIEHAYSRYKDLSKRRTPGIFQQYKLFLGRVIKQRLREARIQFVDFLILCLAGVCLGTLAKVNDETLGADGYTYTIIAVSLLCKIGALRSFSLEKLHYWRESASGMSSLAYFLSKDTVDHFNTLIKPIVYLSMFYFFNNPRSSIGDNYVVLVALVYCVTGIAYWFAIFLHPGSAQLWSVLLPVVLTLIATQQKNSSSKMLTILADLCYPKWALQAFVVLTAQRYPGVWLITRCGALSKKVYDIRDWGLCVAILFGYGLVFRCLAFFCMITFKMR